MPFDGLGNLDGIVGLGGWRVRDGDNRNAKLVAGRLKGEDDGGRPVFGPLLVTCVMLIRPQICVADDLGWFWNGDVHA